MRCTIVLEFQDDEVGHPRRIELMHLHRNLMSPSPGDVGLTLAEGKMLLMAAQQQFVDAQIERYCEETRACRQCGHVRRMHDGKRSQMKTIFGDVNYCRDR